MTLIEDVKARWNVPDVLAAFGLPGPRGRTLKCPLSEQHTHGDRFPSANYYAGDDRWFCHRCQTGGDVIDTVRLLLKTDASDAIRWLADRAGIPRNESRRQSRRSTPVTKHQPPIDRRLQNALDILIGLVHQRLPRYTEHTAGVLDYVWNEFDTLRSLWRLTDFYDGKPSLEELKRRILAVDSWLTWSLKITDAYVTPSKAKAELEAADREAETLKESAFESIGYRVIRDE